MYARQGGTGKTGRTSKSCLFLNLTPAWQPTAFFNLTEDSTGLSMAQSPISARCAGWSTTGKDWAQRGSSVCKESTQHHLEKATYSRDAPPLSQQATPSLDVPLNHSWEVLPKPGHRQGKLTGKKGGGYQTVVSLLEDSFPRQLSLQIPRVQHTVLPQYLLTQD